MKTIQKQDKLKEIRATLEKEEYKFEIYPLHKHKWFESLVDYGDIQSLFDDLVNELGRIPMQLEYVNEGFERGRKFFLYQNPHKKNRKYKGVTLEVGKHGQAFVFNWNDLELQKAVKKRLSRAYPSHLAEYTTLLQLKALYPDYYIGNSPSIDHTMGVDIVVGSKEHNRLIYIHVTSESAQSNSTLKDKATRWGHAKDVNGKSKWWERDFNRGHIHLSFSKFEESDSTEFINGNPIFKAEHLKQVIDTAMNVNGSSFDKMNIAKGESNQLVDFHHWLIENDVKEDGLKNIWI